MTTSKYFPLKVLIVALAAATGGCGTIPSPQADYTYCSRYGNEPECGGQPQAVAVVPAPAPEPVAVAEPAPVVAAAPEPAPAPAPTERTIAVADAGPPPNKAGECYTKIIRPAEWKDEPTQQLVAAATERNEYTEPVYEQVEERVLVKPAGKRITVIPAEYGEVEEQILVREAYRREIDQPELYTTYFERVMEQPARQVWKPGRGAVEKVDPTTGEILCLVEEEAVYKTVERKELARAASKTYEDVPAEYSTVKKTVVKTPESTQEIEVPGEYQTITVTKLVKPPQAVKVAVPAEYATVNKKVMATPPTAEWTQVLCDVNATPERIERVENALKAQGYPVSVDGQIDADLENGVKAFQEQNGLRADGLMTAETLAKLGVELQ